MAGSLSPETASRRSRVIALSRHRGPDDVATIQAKTDLEASKPRDHIERVLTTCRGGHRIAGPGAVRHAPQSGGATGSSRRS